MRAVAKDQAGNPFIEGERPEIKPPQRFPQVKPRPPDGTADLREPVDQENHAARNDERLARARKAFAAAKAANPYFTDEIESPISRVPDDPDWAYKWMRDMLPPDFTNPGGFDSGNVTAHEHGRLSWEVVTPDMLSSKWQHYFLALARKRTGLEGANAGTCYRYKDVILVRTLREARDLQMAAYDKAAELQRMAVNAGTRAAGAERGFPVGFDESEKQGYVDFFE